MEFNSKLEVFVQGSEFYQASQSSPMLPDGTDLPGAAGEYYPSRLYLSAFLFFSFFLFSHSPLEDSLARVEPARARFSAYVVRWAGFSRVKKLVFQRGDKAKSTTHIGLRA